MKKNKVYIIILNYKTWKDTIECLESIYLLDYPNFHVILVDNFSENDSISQIQLWAGKFELKISYNKNNHSDQTRSTRKLNFSIHDYTENCYPDTQENDLTIIKSKENNGFSAGNNIGLLYALQKNNFEFAWILNNDTIVEKGALTALVTYITSNPETGICGSVLLDYNMPHILQGVGGYYNKLTGSAKEVLNGKILSKELFSVPHKINYPIGASLFVQKKFLESVGLMNEEYFLFFEEIDWTLRGRKLGWSFGYAPESFVWHKGSCTINNKSKGKSKVSDYFGVRSKILFTKKFFPAYVLPIYLSVLLLLFNRIRKKQYDRLCTLFQIMLNPKMDYKKILPK